MRESVSQMLDKMPGRVSFHMPGHKHRFGETTRYDVTELAVTDDLHQPEGAYCVLSQRIAAACGATHSFPLVGGSTLGVQAMVLASVQPRRKLILPRNAHLSAWTACVLGDIEPVSVHCRVDESNQFAMIAPEDVCAAMDANRDAQAVLITRPDFYGRMLDVEIIAQHAHRLGMKLLVDEAHGAHLPYALSLRAAGECGADLWSQSFHKTLPALTPCAALNVAHACDVDAVRRKIRMLETSSPSSLLLLSMERALDFMQESGARALENLEAMCKSLRERLNGDKRFACDAFADDMDLDPYRIVIDVRGTGLSGYAVNALLAQAGVDMEMADCYRIVGIPSVMSTQQDFDALFDALTQLSVADAPYCFPAEALAYGKPAMRLRDASMGITRARPLHLCEGQVSADCFGLYPPGIPLVVPGERVTREVLDAVLRCVQAGGTTFGLNGEGELHCVQEL